MSPSLRASSSALVLLLCTAVPASAGVCPPASGEAAVGAAQIENFGRILASMPDVRVNVEDCIVAGDRVVARNTYVATHTQTIRGIAPTGKSFTFHTIDIWRVENGRFAEHWDLTDTAEVLRQLKGE